MPQTPSGFSFGTFNAQNYNTQITLVLPAGLSSGDLMIAFVFTNDFANSSVPTGWTRFVSTLGSGGTFRALDIYYRFYVPGDTNPTFNFTFGNAPQSIGHIFALTGSTVAASPIGAIGTEEIRYGTTTNAGGVTATAGRSSSMIRSSPTLQTTSPWSASGRPA